MTFISRVFHFRIICEFLNSRASIRVVGHFRRIKIGTLRILCERQIDVMYRIAVHVVRSLILELYSSFCPHKETITQFVTHTDSHWIESIIRYSIHHICINSLVRSVKKINIGNPGIQVNNWGGGAVKPPINFAGYLDFQYWFLCTWEPAN